MLNPIAKAVKAVKSQDIERYNFFQLFPMYLYIGEGIYAFEFAFLGKFLAYNRIVMEG